MILDISFYFCVSVFPCKNEGEETLENPKACGSRLPGFALQEKKKGKDLATKKNSVTFVARRIISMDQLKTYTDQRGSLTIVEVGKEVPFEIARVFWIHDVPKGEERAKHANWTTYQYLVAVRGSVDVFLENKEMAETFHLTSLDKGLLVPPGTWNELKNFSEGTVLMVLASDAYNPAAYINSYEEFLQIIGKR